MIRLCVISGLLTLSLYPSFVAHKRVLIRVLSLVHYNLLFHPPSIVNCHVSNTATPILRLTLPRKNLQRTIPLNASINQWAKVDCRPQPHHLDLRRCKESTLRSLLLRLRPTKSYQLSLHLRNDYRLVLR